MRRLTCAPMRVCVRWPQKEPKEQKTADAKTEEQETKGTKAEEQKPEVRPAPPHPLRGRTKEVAQVADAAAHGLASRTEVEAPKQAKLLILRGLLL